MRKFSAKIGVTALFALALFALSISQAFAPLGGGGGGGGGQGPPQVDCDAGESIQAALDQAKNGDTINVSGTCNERVTVLIDNVTIDGGGVTTIEGTDAEGSGALIRVRALNVRILNLTVQNGSTHGIQVQRGGSAIIQGTTVQDNVRHGISVFDHAFAIIGPEPRSDNHDNPPASGSLGNIISGNDSTGVNIGQSSGARIFHNNILGNDSNGIGLSEGGSADISGNSITGNRRGIRLVTNASVRLSDTGHDEMNLIQENTNSGVRCVLGGALRGNPQNFGTGNPGGGNHTDDTDISNDCPVDSSLAFP